MTFFWLTTVVQLFNMLRQLNKIGALLFQQPTKKLKVHDTYDKMCRFSAAWKKYPVLYDEAVQNTKFSEDFKGTGTFIRKCYDELATDLGLSFEEVKKHHVKYVDAVMKGLAQLKLDLDNGTTKLPIPALHKLRLFRWLWPYSKNYHKDIMENVGFDEYIERAVVVEVNKCVHEKKDASAALQTLQRVRELNAENALKKLNLNCAHESILDDDCCVDSSVLCEMENYEDSIKVATSTICAYLPPSKDPTFQYAEAGYMLFEGVSVTSGAPGGKAVRKHSEGIFSCLKSSGDASLKCGNAVRKAKSAQEVYYDASAALIGHSQLPFCDTKDEHAMIELTVAALRAGKSYQESVQSAVTAVQVYVNSTSHFVSNCRKCHLCHQGTKTRSRLILNTYGDFVISQSDILLMAGSVCCWLNCKARDFGLNFYCKQFGLFRGLYIFPQPCSRHVEFLALTTVTYVEHCKSVCFVDISNIMMIFIAISWQRVEHRKTEQECSFSYNNKQDASAMCVPV